MLRQGKRLAVDVGKARIGLAVSDIHAILASPYRTIAREVELSGTVASVLAAAGEAGEILEIYVGVPTNLAGLSTLSTEDAVSFATALEKATAIPVRLIDERLTTSLANNQLKQIGKSQKDARSTIDQMAAVAILEFGLTLEKNSGALPGNTIAQWKESHE